MHPGDHSAKFLANNSVHEHALVSERWEVGNPPSSHLFQQQPPTVTISLSILALANMEVNNLKKINVWERISAVSSGEDTEVACPPPPPDTDFLLKWNQMALVHSHGHH